MRWLFLGFGLFNIAGLIAQVAPVAAIPAGTRLLSIALLVVLGAWWLRGYRRGGFPVRGVPFEAATLFLASLATGDPYLAFGLLYTGTNFRCLYGSRGAVVGYVALQVAASLAAFLVAPSLGLDPDLSGFLRQVPGVPVLGALSHIIAKTVRSQERGLAREQVLLQAGTALSGHGDRAAISRTGVDAARALLADLHGAGASIDLVTPAGREVAATSGATIRAEGGNRSLRVPLRTGQAVHGALAVSGDKAIPSEVRGAIENLGVQLGLALQNASLTDDLRHRAFTDSLTGLANRASLLERIGAETERARRGDAGGRGFAVLVADLDGFKSVNDAHGHAAGDRLLVAAAERLRHSLRPDDTAARLGGDEFAALLTGLGPGDGATTVAERVVWPSRSRSRWTAGTWPRVAAWAWPTGRATPTPTPTRCCATPTRRCTRRRRRARAGWRCSAPGTAPATGLPRRGPRASSRPPPEPTTAPPRDDGASRRRRRRAAAAGRRGKRCTAGEPLPWRPPRPDRPDLGAAADPAEELADPQRPAGGG